MEMGGEQNPPSRGLCERMQRMWWKQVATVLTGVLWLGVSALAFGPRGGPPRCGRGWGCPRQKGGQGERPGAPDLGALDADGDGVLSAEEIAKAADVLKGLDQNGNGALNGNELAPRGGRRPGQMGPGGMGGRGRMPHGMGRGGMMGRGMGPGGMGRGGMMHPGMRPGGMGGRGMMGRGMHPGGVGRGGMMGRGMGPGGMGRGGHHGGPGGKGGPRRPQKPDPAPAPEPEP